MARMRMRARVRQRQVMAQSGLAAVTLAIVLLLEDAANVAVMTAVASSAFLVFAMPSSPMAQVRRLAGGHFVAIAVAFVFSYLLYDSALNELSEHDFSRDLVMAACVGTAIAAMCFTRTQHVPAAGTALGLTLAPWAAGAAIAIATTALVLSVLRCLLRGWLVDLI